MTREVAANLSVILATVVTLSFLVPQIVKLVRTLDSTGVSSAWPAIGLVSNVGWVVFFVNQRLWASIGAPSGATIGYVVTLWALSRTGRLLRRSAVAGIAFGIALVVATVLLGWTALGVLLGLSFGIMLVPSLWVAYRTATPSGISPGTWWLGVAEAFLWGFYGWHHMNAGVLTFAATAFLGSSAMLFRYLSTRSRAAPGTLHPHIS